MGCSLREVFLLQRSTIETNTDTTTPTTVITRHTSPIRQLTPQRSVLALAPRTRPPMATTASTTTMVTRPTATSTAHHTHANDHDRHHSPSLSPASGYSAASNPLAEVSASVSVRGQPHPNDNPCPQCQRTSRHRAYRSRCRPQDSQRVLPGRMRHNRRQQRRWQRYSRCQKLCRRGHG